MYHEECLAEWGNVTVNQVCPLCLIPLPPEWQQEAGEEKPKLEAIKRIVEASKGLLNWSHELPMSSWNCVTEVAGGSFEVRLGVEGDHPCGFNFTKKVTLADFILVFGSKVTVLDVSGQKKCTGKKPAVLFEM